MAHILCILLLRSCKLGRVIFLITILLSSPGCEKKTTYDYHNEQYDIEFKVGDNTSNGRLSCTSGEFRLQMNNLAQVKINGPVLKKVSDVQWSLWGSGKGISGLDPGESVVV